MKNDSKMNEDLKKKTHSFDFFLPPQKTWMVIFLPPQKKSLKKKSIFLIRLH